MPHACRDSHREASGPLSACYQPLTYKYSDLSAPTVPYYQPLRSARNSSLRIACILEDRLFRGLEDEAELYHLSEGNDDLMLHHAEPDLLLIESCWRDAVGGWNMAQSFPVEQAGLLDDALRTARSLHTPVVYWITKDVCYLDYFKDFARKADFVFCADPRVAEALRSQGVAAEVLLPAFQPTIYNPFCQYAHCKKFNFSVLYDGWADLDFFQHADETLGPLRKHLTIVDSRNLIFANRRALSPEFSDQIYGCIPERARVMMLKYASVSVSLDPSRLTPTSRQWMALETAACRLPQVHFGAIPPDDMRRDFIEAFDDPDEFVEAVQNLLSEELPRERTAQKAWRAAYQSHTLSHRLRTICAALGVGHDWVEHPPVTVITPSHRPHRFTACLEQFDAQSYPRKELVMVFNNPDGPPPEAEALNQSRSDVVILPAPPETITAGSMNIGLLHASGHYCFKVDDDDIYGPHYLEDMVLHTRSAETPLYGKYPLFFTFESDSSVYQSKRNPSLSIADANHIDFGQAWVAGCSLMGRRDIFRKLWFDLEAYGSEDAQLVFKVSQIKQKNAMSIVDPLNMVISRQQDLSAHTWKVDEARLKRNNYFIGHRPEIIHA